jgi:leucyl aminopeptidase
MIIVLPYQVKATAMEIPYKHSSTIAINQYLKDPSSTQLESASAVILVLPPAPVRIPWNRHPCGDHLRKRWNQRVKQASGDTPFITELPGGTRTVMVRTVDTGAFEQLGQARKVAAEALGRDPGRVLVQCFSLNPEQDAELCDALTAALLAAVCPMPSMKRKPDQVHPLKRIDYFGLHKKIDLRQTQAECQGNHLARWLTSLPPNYLAPSHYVSHVRKLAKRHGWTVDVLNSKTLRQKKAGAFLAVTQASETDDAAIVRLSYRPAKMKRQPALALVGKGICFDTGGVNLKTARYMHGMHEDMEGSAVALGTLLALTLLEVDFGIDCWLALAENQIGPAAYKPNDVVTASNGTSIEIIHTDAEGRMVLADTLAFAGQTKPALIVDYATLTGACVYSLSTRLSGVFSNRDTLIPVLMETGRDSGERVWPFPMEKDFDELLDSQVADVKQCTLEGEADHILAARFLNRFVPDDVAWIHVDLAAGNHKSGLAHIPTDVTGFGVRFTLNLLLHKRILSQKDIKL